MNSLSRREFVRSSALGAGAVALAGPFIRSARAANSHANSHAFKATALLLTFAP